MFNAKKCNLSNTDANIRFVLSFFILIVAIYINSYGLMILSMALAFNGLTKHCYLYQLFNINTKEE